MGFYQKMIEIYREKIKLRKLVCKRKYSELKLTNKKLDSCVTALTIISLVCLYVFGEYLRHFLSLKLV